MPYISYSHYQTSCEHLVRTALTEPVQFNESLSEFECFLFGYDDAFRDLGGWERSVSFGDCLRYTLHNRCDLSGARGFAFAINETAKSKGIEPFLLFAEIVEGYLSDWMRSPIRENAEQPNVCPLKQHSESAPYSIREYRSYCSEIVRHAILRPSMYYRDLTEFENILAGSQYAFQNLGIINVGDGFNSCFRNWIEELSVQSCQGGWSLTIENLAKNKGSSPQDEFAEIADPFLMAWAN